MVVPNDCSLVFMCFSCKNYSIGAGWEGNLLHQSLV